ncbi:unnamed protein product [Adineta ricciae]|uniref:Hexosyltransferase n=1 Tax=Adineta ricciae TaxID=249248 RepID=A0A813RV67_ADIRI|nr:unnamed protein product [Adineta ricciae]
MYSPARKVRASIRRTLFLILTGILSGLLLIETVLEFGQQMTKTSYEPTRSAGLMLNRSQMLLAKEVILEPFMYPCKANLKSATPSYPLYIIIKTRAVSSGAYFQRRIFTRSSWGQEARTLGIPVIYAIGKPKDAYTQVMLERENKNFGDLLQLNYIDAYYNITIKSTGILNWFASRGCEHVTPYLFVVDDDVLLNLPPLLSMISNHTFNFNTIYGLYLADIEPHPSGKWAVSLTDFPNRTYPTFIIGASTLYPAIVVPKLVDSVFSLVEQSQPIFFLDDVLFSGIIAEQLGIQRAPMAGIEDCSYTDLFSRVIITECSNLRRLYIWSKFILSRLGQDTYEVDRLISKTSYTKWRGDFVQMRNGTAIIQPNEFDQSTLNVFFGYHFNISFLALLILIFVFISIFISKLLPTRQISQKLPSVSLASPRANLLTPIK